MVGRAGRPQFDDSGVAVIMTEACTRDKYLKMSSGALKIESHLHSALLEHLNTEISLGTVASETEALHWLTTTFLWSSVPQDSTEEAQRAALQLKVKHCLDILHNKGFISKPRSGATLHPPIVALLPCRVASKHALSVATVEHLIQSFVPHLLQLAGSVTIAPAVSEAAVTEEFFWYTVCRCEEFARSVRLRQGDKKLLNALLRAKQTQWRLAGNRVKTLEDKVFVLVQLRLASVNPGSYDLQMDARACLDILARLSKALVNILASEEVRSSLVVYAHSMYRSAVHGMWGSDVLPLKQLDSLRRHAKRLGDLNIKSFADLVRLHDKDLHEIAKLPDATVKSAAKELGGLVPAHIEAEAKSVCTGDPSEMEVFVTITGAVPRRLEGMPNHASEWQHGWYFWLFDDNGSLLAQKRVRRYESAELVFSITIAPHSLPKMTICVQHAYYVGLDVFEPVSIAPRAATGSIGATREQQITDSGDDHDVFGHDLALRPQSSNNCKQVEDHRSVVPIAQFQKHPLQNQTIVVKSPLNRSRPPAQLNLEESFKRTGNKIRRVTQRAAKIHAQNITHGPPTPLLRPGSGHSSDKAPIALQSAQSLDPPSAVDDISVFSFGTRASDTVESRGPVEKASDLGVAPPLEIDSLWLSLL
jgi:hypothetical protein